MSKAPYNLKTQIRSALRKLWLYSPMRRDALARARVAYGKYQCPQCSRVQGPKLMDVDHVVKVTPPGFDPDKDPRQWGVLIERMLYMDPVKGLIALCKDCHKTKTLEERREAKTNIKKKTRKSSKRVNRLRSARTKGIHKRRA